MKLYFGNLATGIDDARLNELVSPFGKPDSATVVTDRVTRQSRGFGFVEMSSADEARAVIAALDGKEVDGRALKVNEARPSRDAGRGGSRR